MSQLSSLHGTVFRRAIIVVAALALTACTQRAAPRVGDPVPPPGAVTPGPAQPYGTPPSYAPPPPAGYGQAGAQDAVLRGAAYLQAGGSTQVQPGSRMTVRVYDAERADVNRPIAERVFTSNGQGLPWAYELRVPLESMRTLTKPAVAARIESPDGRLLYLNDRAVTLSEGGADDIPMVPANAGSSGFTEYRPAGTPTPQPNYTDYGLPQQQAQPTYGIPDYDPGYGAPTYDVPTYPGQTYDSPSISGPPSNTIY